MAAGRGAALTCPRHVIHFRALRVPRETEKSKISAPPYGGADIFGDPYGTRTHVTAVKGRCLNHLTNGPDKWMPVWIHAGIRTGSGTWIRTGDTSGMNRMLWPTELCRHMLFKQHRDFIRRHARCQQNFSVSESFLRVSLRPQAERYAAGSTSAPLRRISKCRWEGWPISQRAVSPTVPSSMPASTHSPALTAVSSSRLA